MDKHDHYQQDPAPVDAHVGHDMSARAHGSTTGGHDRHEGHSVAMFRDKFWWSLALTIPVVLHSHDIQQWVGYSIPMSRSPAVFR